MREVIYTDRRGFLRRRMVRDGDGDEMAEFGMPTTVPDVEHDVDWEGIVREINNILVQNNVTSRTMLHHTRSLEDVCNVVKRHVDVMFNTHDHDTKNK